MDVPGNGRRLRAVQKKPKVTIFELRNRLRMSQLELANQLGTTATTIYRWEKERSAPIPVFRKKLEALARTIGVRI